MLLSVCLSVTCEVTSFSRLTENQAMKQATCRTRYLLGSELCHSGFISFVRELWRDLLTLIAVAGDLDFTEDSNCPYLTA